MKRKNWTKKQLEASVESYIEMRNKEKRNEKFIKKEVYRKLSKRFKKVAIAKDNQQLINELERKHEEFLSYGIKDLILAKKVLDEKEIIINEGITRVNEKILFFQEQVSSGDDLLQKGLITKALQLQSKQNLSYAKEELKNNINQLKQIDKYAKEEKINLWEISLILNFIQNENVLSL